jgi:predicted RNA-binding protein with RPS1 domain
MTTLINHNVAITPAFVLLIASMIALIFISTDNNSFGFAWTITKKNSYLHPFSRMNEIRPCDFYFHSSLSVFRRRRYTCCALGSSSMETNGSDIDVGAALSQQRPLCFYRSPVNNRWKQRIEIQNLSIGQELHGVIVQEKLTNTTTGPKVWLDVGVCRWSSRGKPYTKETANGTTSLSSSATKGGWKICTALLRLGMNNYVKESVIRKRIARLRNKATITVYVSRIFVNEGRFDVVLTPEEVDSSTAIATSSSPLQSVTKLNVGDEVTGTVTKVVDYGAFLQLDGYNRCGLLHIKQVAELYGTYIDKKQGLIDSGLNPKSRVRLQVIEKDKRRILLDFTADVKQIALEEQRQEQEEIERQQNELRAQLQQQREKAQTKGIMVESTLTNVSSTSDSTYSTMETSDVLGTPTEYDVGIGVDDANNIDTDLVEEDIEEDGEEEEYDNYDEERDIEDALGLGMY